MALCVLKILLIIYQKFFHFVESARKNSHTSSLTIINFSLKKIITGFYYLALVFIVNK